jgi:hypothetical protein
MPIPKPKAGEKQNDFVSRCVSAISDEYEQKQAAAICYNEYRKNKAKTLVKALSINIKKWVNIRSSR